MHSIHLHFVIFGVNFAFWLDIQPLQRASVKIIQLPSTDIKTHLNLKIWKFFLQKTFSLCHHFSFRLQKILCRRDLRPVDILAVQMQLPSECTNILDNNSIFTRPRTRGGVDFINSIQLNSTFYLCLGVSAIVVNVSTYLDSLPRAGCRSNQWGFFSLIEIAKFSTPIQSRPISLDKLKIGKIFILWYLCQSRSNFEIKIHHIM